MQRNTLIIIGTSLTVLILGILIVVVIARRRAPTSTTPTPTTVVEGGEVVSADDFNGQLASCNDSDNPGACKDELRFNVAQDDERPELCDEIGEGDTRDLCYDLLAKAIGDAALCGKVQAFNMQSKCKTRVAYEGAITSGDPNRCAEFTDLERRSCFNLLFADVSNKGGCDAYDGEVRDECEKQLSLGEIVESGDKSDCEELLVDDVSGVCDELFPTEPDPNEDSDGDGLSNADEEKYGSNPYMKDTDGDGYSDGDEVKNGYSPVGPGVLNP